MDYKTVCNIRSVKERLIEAGKSSNNGWSMAQLNLLGIHEFKKGWKRRLINDHISVDTYKIFASLKDAHLSTQKLQNLAIKKAAIQGVATGKTGRNTGRTNPNNYIQSDLYSGEIPPWCDNCSAEVVYK